MRISDGSADVCSSDLPAFHSPTGASHSRPSECGWRQASGCRSRGSHKSRRAIPSPRGQPFRPCSSPSCILPRACCPELDLLFVRRTADDTLHVNRSEEHTSELQSLMRISYAVFCLKKKTKKINPKPRLQ